MSDIKLFGKVIHLGSDFKEDCEYVCTSTDDHHSEQSKNRGVAKKISREEPKNAKQDRESSSSCVLETPPNHSSNTGNPKTLSSEKGCSSDDKEDSSDRTSSNDTQDQNSPPKKPDKILPCPRCSSMNTKFCYFNNYNVNQPRHFCKECQRYWTAGGTMRNVPVGAGRRKNKSSSASQYRHLLNPAASDGLILPARRINGTVLSFSQDSYPAESRAAMKTYGFVKESIDANSIFVEKRGNGTPEAVQTQGPCLQGSPWAYSCHPMPLRPGFPVPFHSKQTQWISNSFGSWNFQYHSAHSDQSSSSCSPNSSSPSRKHPRDGTILLFGPSNSDNNKDLSENESPENHRVPVPKISRIDDPIEAANSSIWSTIRSKNSHVTSNAKAGFFGRLEQFNGIGNERSNSNAEVSSMALQLNPAAFSRSLTFHEIAR